MKLFYLCLLLLSPLLSAESFSPYKGDSIRFSNLSSIDTVKGNVIENIKPITNGGEDVNIERLMSSEWFSVSVDGKGYLTDPDGKNWLRTSFEGLYSFTDGVKQITVSNKTRESLMGLSLFLKGIEEMLPSYGPNSPKETIYAFVDVTCPHCKKFHLTARSEIEKTGVKLVYVPFARSVNNQAQISANMEVFCSPNTGEIKNNLDEVYLLSPIELTSKMWSPKCNKLQQAVFSFLVGNGHRYNFKGSPMFLTELGDALYGTSSLHHYLIGK